MFFYHMMSNAAAKGVWTHLRGPEVIAAIIHSLLHKATRKLEFNICLLYPTVNSKITLKSMFFHHKTSDAAAMVSGVISGAAKNDRGNNTKAAK